MDEQINEEPPPFYSQKNYSVTLLLAMWIGIFGAHRFYLGRWRSGCCILLLALTAPIITLLGEWVNSFASTETAHRTPVVHIQDEAHLFAQVNTSKKDFVLNKDTAKHVTKKNKRTTLSNRQSNKTSERYVAQKREESHLPSLNLNTGSYSFTGIDTSGTVFTIFIWIPILACAIWVFMDVLSILTQKFKDVNDGLLVRKFDEELAGHMSFKATLLLAWLLGMFGIHRFYTGHYFTGAGLCLLFLLSNATGGGFIAGLFTIAYFIWITTDIIRIVFLRFKDADGWLVVR